MGGGANFYSYVGNSAPNRADPSGYCSKDQMTKSSSTDPSIFSCAMTVADETSIAGYFDLGDGAVTQSVFGNTWSGIAGLVKEARHLDFPKTIRDLALGGYGQGVILGGGLARGGLMGRAEDLFFNSITGEGTGLTTLELTGTGSETVAAVGGVSLATVVSTAKLAWDSYAILYGLGHCW
jgi:hypothetical protein